MIGGMQAETHTHTHTRAGVEQREVSSAEDLQRLQPRSVKNTLLFGETPKNNNSEEQQTKEKQNFISLTFFVRQEVRTLSAWVGGEGSGLAPDSLFFPGD